MTQSLSIDAEWETLRQGSAEECACFSALGIRYGEIWLTEAEDSFVKRLRTKVHLSSYSLAEWLAWNWWRLRWEPRKQIPNWGLAHRLTTIGGGYVWPNLTIFSDGERVALLAKPTKPRPEEPLRYLTDMAVVVRAAEFENAIDRFMEQVQGQLQAEGITGSNLNRIWSDVVSERHDLNALSYRRLEALMGFDPDEAEESTVQMLVESSRSLGGSAVDEVAAGCEQQGRVITEKWLRETAETNGYDANPKDAVRLNSDASLSPIGYSPAWRRGAKAAQILRRQEQLGEGPISDKKLAQLSGVPIDAISKAPRTDSDISFVLDIKDDAAKIVLRSKWVVGRRFDVARLLGDRLANTSSGSLFPATKSYTYRQKMQRSFAAELLCPFEILESKLNGDYASDAIEDVAELFAVSPMVVHTILVNNGRLDRENLEYDIEYATS